MTGSLSIGRKVSFADVALPCCSVCTDFLEGFETSSFPQSVCRGIFLGVVLGTETLPWEKLDSDQLFLGLGDRSLGTCGRIRRSDAVPCLRVELDCRDSSD